MLLLLTLCFKIFQPNITSAPFSHHIFFFLHEPWSLHYYSCTCNCSVTRWRGLTGLKQLQAHYCYVLSSPFLVRFFTSRMHLMTVSPGQIGSMWTFDSSLQSKGKVIVIMFETQGSHKGLPLWRVHITGYQTLICLAGTSNFCRLPSSFSFHFFHCKQKSNKHKQSIEHIRKQKEQTDHKVTLNMDLLAVIHTTVTAGIRQH